MADQFELMRPGTMMELLSHFLIKLHCMHVGGTVLTGVSHVFVDVFAACFCTNMNCPIAHRYILV